MDCEIGSNCSTKRKSPLPHSSVRAIHTNIMSNQIYSTEINCALRKTHQCDNSKCRSLNAHSCELNKTLCTYNRIYHNSIKSHREQVTLVPINMKKQSIPDNEQLSKRSKSWILANSRTPSKQLIYYEDNFFIRSHRYASQFCTDIIRNKYKLKKKPNIQHNTFFYVECV